MLAYIIHVTHTHTIHYGNYRKISSTNGHKKQSSYRSDGEEPAHVLNLEYPLKILADKLIQRIEKLIPFDPPSIALHEKISRLIFVHFTKNAGPKNPQFFFAKCLRI